MFVHFSTPYRSEPPSLHEELLAQQGPGRGFISPLVDQLDDSQSMEELDSSGTADDDFSRIIQQAVRALSSSVFTVQTD